MESRRNAGSSDSDCRKPKMEIIPTHAFPSKRNVSMTRAERVAFHALALLTWNPSDRHDECAEVDTLSLMDGVVSCTVLAFLPASLNSTNVSPFKLVQLA